MAHLTLFHPQIDRGRGRVLPLQGDSVVLGRHPSCDGVLDHRNISRKHARLERGPYGWLLTDLGSANGTFACGQRVTGRMVEDGEELRLGDVRVVLSLPEAPPLAPHGTARSAPRAAPPPASPRSPPSWASACSASASSRRGTCSRSSGWRPSFRLLARRHETSASTADSGGRPSAPAAANELEPPWPPPIEPGARQEVESAVTGVEGAFREGRLEAVASVLHPSVGEGYGRVFAAHQAELPRVADLLSTRKLVLLTPDRAEYEVAERGRTFRVTFEKVKGNWVLSSL